MWRSLSDVIKLSRLIRLCVQFMRVMLLRRWENERFRLKFLTNPYEQVFDPAAKGEGGNAEREVLSHSDWFLTVAVSVKEHNWLNLIVQS